jgi:hypothetical protein
MNKQPHMLRALRQAQLYGYLIVRDESLYHPGGSHPLCRLNTAQQMVRSGWLFRRDGKYELTPEGHRVCAAERNDC